MRAAGRWRSSTASGAAPVSSRKQTAKLATATSFDTERPGLSGPARRHVIATAPRSSPSERHAPESVTSAA